jgi:hypothetical protein
MDDQTPIDEVSKRTLGRYIEKAATSMSAAAFGQGQASASRRPPSESDIKIGSKRMTGIVRATSRLTKEATDPDALHVKPVKVNGQTKYQVHAVGKNFAGGIKKGEHLSDTELDDFADMGGKIKHIKEEETIELSAIRQLLNLKAYDVEERTESAAEMVSRLLEAQRGRPRKNPVAAPTKSQEDDDDEGPEAHEPAGVDTKHIQVELSRVSDYHDMPKKGDHIEFKTGKHFVSAHTAKRAHGFLMSLKPDDRAKASTMMFNDHKVLKHFE